MKQSHKKLIFLLLLPLCWSACKKGETSSNVDLSGTYLLVLDRDQQIPEGKKIATATLFSYTDSRCPITYDCVDAGSVTAKVRFKDQAHEETIDICLGSCYTNLRTFTSRGVKYVMTLKTFQPYPGNIAQVAIPPTATIEISKMH